MGSDGYAMVLTASLADRAIKNWPTRYSRDWLASFLDRVRENPNVVAVVVVGSAIRSAVSSDDLDLVVICRDRRLLREKAPIEIDLRSFDLDQIEGDVRRGQDLLTWSLQYGECLYDPSGVWADLVHRWRGRLPLPDVSVAKSRAETALAHLEVMRAAGDDDAAVDLNVSYLTHLARAALAKAGVFPASRPELPDQLRDINQADLADRLDRALSARTARRTSRMAV